MPAQEKHKNKYCVDHKNVNFMLKFIKKKKRKTTMLKYGPHKGVAKWDGSAYNLLKKTRAGCLFQSVGLLRPISHNPQPARTKCGAGRVGPHKSHNFKMYTFFFYTLIFSSYSVIFYILKFLITSYYACFMKIIL